MLDRNFAAGSFYLQQAIETAVDARERRQQALPRRSLKYFMMAVAIRVDKSQTGFVSRFLASEEERHLIDLAKQVLGNSARIGSASVARA